MIKMFKVITCIDYMNCQKFFCNFGYGGTRDFLNNICIFNMIEYKVKNMRLVEDLHIFRILNYHN